MQIKSKLKHKGQTKECQLQKNKTQNRVMPKSGHYTNYTEPFKQCTYTVACRAYPYIVNIFIALMKAAFFDDYVLQTCFV